LTRYGFQLQPEDGIEQIPAGELERTMKVQEVILRAMGKKSPGGKPCRACCCILMVAITNGFVTVDGKTCW
jgi:hypothetical protein